MKVMWLNITLEEINLLILQFYKHYRFFVSGRPNMFTFLAYIIAYTKPVWYVKLQKESLTLFKLKNAPDMLHVWIFDKPVIQVNLCYSNNKNIYT